jgi:hypothetical protein
MTEAKGTSKSFLKNQRKFRRLTFDCQAQLFSGTEFWLCQVVNLSLKGVKITRPPTWSGKIDDSLRLIVSLNGSPSISMLVKVKHFNDLVMGLKWHKIDIDSFNRLKRIIELNSLLKNQLNDEIKLLKDTNNKSI